MISEIEREQESTYIRFVLYGCANTFHKAPSSNIHQLEPRVPLCWTNLTTHSVSTASAEETTNEIAVLDSQFSFSDDIFQKEVEKKNT